MDIKSDIESLLGVCLEGDVTEMVAQLLKTSKYKEDILAYRVYARDINKVDDICRKLKENKDKAEKEKQEKKTIQEQYMAQSFEDFLAGL